MNRFDFRHLLDEELEALTESARDELIEAEEQPYRYSTAHIDHLTDRYSALVEEDDRRANVNNL